MMFTRRSLLVGCLGFATVGCQTAPSSRIYPELTFNYLPPIRLNIAQLDIVSEYVPAQKEPYVDHLFPQVPIKVATRWAQDRLQAVGTTGEATYTIEDASATSTPLPRTQGLTGMLTIDQSERCDLRIAVRLELFRVLPVASGVAKAEATRSRTMPEDMTLNEREAAWFEMTEQAMRDLDKSLTRAIRDNLGPFLVS